MPFPYRAVWGAVQKLEPVQPAHDLGNHFPGQVDLVDVPVQMIQPEDHIEGLCMGLVEGGPLKIADNGQGFPTFHQGDDFGFFHFSPLKINPPKKGDSSAVPYQWILYNTSKILYFTRESNMFPI